ncbi:hypothetical protein [Saccharococcus thermophilus]|uniref:hypothetical protein n=1 Tax=Saccharococcus thermophilus TaxID=29396 RepID=UPI0036D30875
MAAFSPLRSLSVYVFHRRFVTIAQVKETGKQSSQFGRNKSLYILFSTTDFYE